MRTQLALLVMGTISYQRFIFRSQFSTHRINYRSPIQILEIVVLTYHMLFMSRTQQS